MFRTYLKTALRNLTKNKLVAFLNITGLTLGITAAWLLSFYVADEWQYDGHHEAANRTYRIAMDVQMGDTERKVAVSPPPLAPLLTEYNEVENFALLRPFRTFQMQKEGETLMQENIFFASPGILDVFDFRWIHGDPLTALNQPESIILTQSVALRYFGDDSEQVLGKLLARNDSSGYTVTGIIANVTEKGHFTPEAFVSVWSADVYENWGDWNWHSYIELKEGASIENLEPAFAEIYETHLASRLAEAGGGSIDFVPQHLPDIHFTSKRDFEIQPNDGNRQALLAFGLITFLLLLIAAINYMNLATAASLFRVKEIGVRKSLGANRWQIARQFLTESLLTVLFAVLCSVLLSLLLLPLFNHFTGNEWEIGDYWGWKTLPALAVFSLLVALLAGLYPSLFLSKFRPVKALKGEPSNLVPTQSFLRQTLLVIQFTISGLMFTGTAAMFLQLQFLKGQSLGFEPEQVINIPLNRATQGRFEALKNRLLEVPDIHEVATANTIPSQAPAVNGFQLPTIEGEQQEILQQIWVDRGFIPTLEIGLLAGRNFAERSTGDTTAAGVLVNSALAELLGFSPEEALGKVLRSQEWSDEIIGVTENFHVVSLHKAIQPMVIRHELPARNLLVKANTTNIGRTLKQIQSAFMQVTDEPKPDHTFLDEQFAQQYKADERRGQLLAIFSGTVIWIACMGLFGLATFSVHRKSKEIGIRKILGASWGSLLLLLSKEYLRLVLIAFALAIPIANYFIAEWLEDFAYRIRISVWLFLLPALFLFLVAFLAVGSQSLRAASANPVKALRDE